MGWQDWVWSSSTPADNTQQVQQSAATSSLTPPSTIPPQTQEPSPPARQLSRDEQAELEFRNLLKELDQPPTPFSTLPADSPGPRDAGSHQLNIDPDSLHPAALLPTDMSCRAAFDAAFYCQSMGGQFVNLYRYGGVRNCSELWSSFWFCMRTNRGGLEDEERMNRIRKHYWERDERYRTGPSSEDVWKARTRKVNDAFDGDFEALEKAGSSG